MRGNMQVCSLWDKLPQQPIAVLVQTALPRRVRVRKVSLGTQRFLYRLVFGKLAAVVKGDGMHLLDVGR